LYNGPTRASAVSSNGVSWDGTDDYGQTATTSLHGFGSFSFSAWLRADQFATNNYHVRLLSKEAVFFFGFLSGTKRQVSVDIGSGASWQGAVTSGTVLPSNAWVHAAATYQAGTVRFYLDGQMTDPISKTYTMGTNANPVRVAHPFSPFNGPLDGTLDEVRLYDRALSGPEIMLLTPDNFRTIRRTLAHLRAQTARDQLELVIVAPAAEPVDPSFPAVRHVPLRDLTSTAAACAASCRSSRLTATTMSTSAAFAAISG